MVLADTNFLEILLDQEAAARCKAFLTEQAGRIILSDFSLPSVGVILLRQKRPKLFQSFLADVLLKRLWACPLRLMTW